MQAPLSYIATIVRIELSVQAPLSYIATIVLIKLSVQAPQSYIATIVLIKLSVVTARVWCRGRIDRKRNSTINLTTDSGACY